MDTYVHLLDQARAVVIALYTSQGFEVSVLASLMVVAAEIVDWEPKQRNSLPLRLHYLA